MDQPKSSADHLHRSLPLTGATPIGCLTNPSEKFARLESSGGILLIVCTIVCGRLIPAGFYFLSIEMGPAWTEAPAPVSVAAQQEIQGMRNSIRESQPSVEQIEQPVARTP